VRGATLDDVKEAGKGAAVTFRGYLSELTDAMLDLSPYDHYVPPFPKGLVYTTASICIGAFIVNCLIMIPAFLQLTGVETVSVMSTNGTSLIGPLLADSTGRLILLFAVNIIFCCAAGVGCVLVMHSLVIRKQFINKTVDTLFEAANLADHPEKQDRYREIMYLSGPHLFSIAGLVMGMTFFFVFTAYSVLVSHTSSAASYLWLAFAALLVAMVYLRLYAKEATEVLYANLKNEAELIKGTGKGATSCLVCFAIGMLLLDAPLFIAPLEYSYNCGTYGTIFRTACTGFGLPPFIEEQLVPILDAIWFYTTIFYVPICFVGLGSIVGVIRLGAWVGPNNSRPCCSVKTDYKSAVAQALSAGDWPNFKKTRVQRGYVLQFLNLGVLVGVSALIPIYTVAYLGVRSAYTSCAIIKNTAPDLLPMLSQNAQSTLYQLEPLVAQAKAVAVGALAAKNAYPDSPLSARLEAMKIDQASLMSQTDLFEIDLQPACQETLSIITPVEECKTHLSSIALALSHYPLFASNTTAEYVAVLLPLCTRFEEYLGEFSTFCQSGETTLEYAPPKIKDDMINALFGAFEMTDKTLAFVLSQPQTDSFVQFVIDLNMTYYKDLAVGLDAIDYSEYYPTSCEVLEGLHFWMLTMFTGLFLHVPPAMIAWLLTNRYSMIMRRQEAEVLSASPASGKGKEMC